MAFFYEMSDGMQTGSDEKFFEMTGARWTADVISQSPIEGAPPPNIAEKQLMNFLLPLYQSFRKHPLKLLIKQGAFNGGLSVHAIDKIQKGSVVAEYAGEWLPGSKEASSYRWGPIEAARYRGCAALVEDGFPNVAAFYLYNVNGIPLRILFVALEDILSGEMIAIHYGMNHSVKVQYHAEYRIDEMRSFIQNISLEKSFKKIKELRSRLPADLGWRRTLELEALTAKIRYIYQTPGTLMLLISKGILKPDEVFYFYGQAEFRYFIAGFPLRPNAREREIAEYLELICESFSKQKSADISLLFSLRHRIFFSAYLRPLLNGEDPLAVENEALLWNEAFDLLQKGEKEPLLFKLEQVVKRKELIEACILYAQELRSPLASWLQSLSGPLFPLRPAA